MRRQLSFITNQRGFFLPYVLFVTSLIFILTMSNITVYRNNLQITANQIEQIKIETLFQMGYTKIKEEIDQSDLEKDIVNYTFPDGTVEISIAAINDDQYKLNFTIFTKEQESIYHLTNILQMVGDSD